MSPFRSLRRAYRALLQTADRLDRVENSLRNRSGSPIDEFVSLSYATRRDGLFDGTYDLWRVKRIAKILEIRGIEELEGTRLLELGAGHGDIGALMASLGAEVTCVDGRVENLNFGRLKFREISGLTFIHADLDQDFRWLGGFDLILHLGLLYHIEGVDQHLGRCFEMTDDLILESVVCDSTDPSAIVIVGEEASVNEEALSGRGSRPSPFYIERLATEHGFDFERHFSSDLNAGHYVYDWEHKDDGSSDGFSRRRMWRMTRNRGDGGQT